MPPEPIIPDRTPLDDDKLIRDVEHQEDIERIAEAQLEQLSQVADTLEDIERILVNTLELQSSIVGTAASLDVAGVAGVAEVQKQTTESLEHINAALLQLHEAFLVQKEVSDMRPLLEALILEVRKPLTARIVVV